MKAQTQAIHRMHCLTARLWIMEGSALSHVSDLHVAFSSKDVSSAPFRRCLAAWLRNLSDGRENQLRGPRK